MDLKANLRIYHRYLGFFLAGIMAMYAISGTVLIFRKTDFLKFEKHVSKTMPADFKVENLAKAMEKREVKIEKVENGILYFKNGTYNTQTHLLDYSGKEYPEIMEKMEHIHTATTDSPLFYLNVFFGLSLLFFVISSFFMFLPGSSIFKKGLYFALAGAVLTLIMFLI